MKSPLRIRVEELVGGASSGKTVLPPSDSYGGFTYEDGMWVGPQKLTMAEERELALQALEIRKEKRKMDKAVKDGKFSQLVWSWLRAWAERQGK